MSIPTTCIGAYPKPDYIEIDNFAETERQDGVLHAHLPIPTTLQIRYPKNYWCGQQSRLSSIAD
jgi:hypothetical protein